MLGHKQRNFPCHSHKEFDTRTRHQPGEENAGEEDDFLFKSGYVYIISICGGLMLPGS